MRQHYDEPNDFVTVVIGIHIGNEYAVNLESVYWKPGEPTQRRIPGSKVVDAQENSKCLKVRDHRKRTVRVSHSDRFHNFKIDRVGSDSGLLNNRANLFCQFRLDELFRADIHAHGKGWVAAELRLPRAQLMAGFEHERPID